MLLFTLVLAFSLAAAVFLLVNEVRYSERLLDTLHDSIEHLDAGRACKARLTIAQALATPEQRDSHVQV